MDKLIIVDEWELYMLKEMLKDLPYYMSLDNTKLSAITNKTRLDIINRIEEIEEL